MMLRLLLLFLAFFLGSDPAQARNIKVVKIVDYPKYQNKPIPQGATRWHCMYNGGGFILCTLGSSGMADTAKLTIDPRLPQEVGQILNAAATLATGVVSIPLHTTPYDMELVGKLAEAVVCSVKTMCGIVFGESQEDLRAHITAAEALVLAGR